MKTPLACQVEADLFSGQPNPQWRLSSSETRELLAALERLPVLSVPSSHLEPLGYRGIKVLYPPQELGGNPLVLMFSQGVVQVGTGKSARWLEDKDSRLERWLIKTAANHIGKGLSEYLKAVVG